MAKIVAALGMSHLLLNADETESERRSVFDGNKEVGECVRRAKPDVLLIIAGDHKFNDTPGRGVATADTYTPCGDLGNPQTPYKGHPEFASQLIDYCGDNGFALEAIDESFRPDHSFSIPIMFATPNHSIPVVQMVILVDDVPQPSESYAYGDIVREFIEKHRPKDERVAVIASGGLSHWVFIEDPLLEFEPDPNATSPGVNETFDREVLSRFEEGDVKRLAAEWTNDQLLEQAGNGALELCYWFVMAGMLPENKGRTIYYEPLSAWGTGMGAIEIFADA
jgi:2'-aminobiphenyl-2,3-diol 1,2-dioxygenase, large subunit